jgi:hypothetical protein
MFFISSCHVGAERDSVADGVVGCVERHLPDVT